MGSRMPRVPITSSNSSAATSASRMGFSASGLAEKSKLLSELPTSMGHSIDSFRAIEGAGRAEGHDRERQEGNDECTLDGTAKYERARSWICSDGAAHQAPPRRAASSGDANETRHSI